MTTRKTHNGTAYARNPYVQFDEGEVVPAATSRRGSGKFTYATLALPVLLAVVTFGQEAADTYTFIVSGVPVQNLCESTVSDPGNLTTGGFSVSATTDSDCEARYRTVAYSEGGGLRSTKLRSLIISFR